MARGEGPWYLSMSAASALEDDTSEAGSPGTRMRPTLGIEEFEQVRKLLNQYAGLWFAAELRPAIERRLRERLVALNLPDFSSYVRRLADDHIGELGEAAEACTVNETYAFRGERQLSTFRSTLLPRLASGNRPTTTKGNDESSLIGGSNPRSSAPWFAEPEPSAVGPRSVAIWSAGCATGEEAYTLAALAAARRGVYSASSFRDQVTSKYEKYFVLQPDRTRVVSDELRSICHFRQANLLEHSPGGFIDVVFCRNVLIHMDSASRRRIVQQFWERLSPGGYLVLGHSESLLKEKTDFVVEELPDDIVYRRPRVGEGPASVRSHEGRRSR
jgi:chemotaxis protein methyltransferase CheR